ncbi:hypothetical protein AVP43_00262 [Geobacillus stearothermophilus]|nr:hypothetical protein AVP43_00262 [Geobacillus stearothermophilus]
MPFALAGGVLLERQARQLHQLARVPIMGEAADLRQQIDDRGVSQPVDRFQPLVLHRRLNQCLQLGVQCSDLRLQLAVSADERGDLKPGHRCPFRHPNRVLRGVDQRLNFGLLRAFHPFALPVHLKKLLHRPAGHISRKRRPLQHRKRRFPQVTKHGPKLWKIPIRPADDRVFHRRLFLAELLFERAPHAQIGFNLVQQPGNEESSVFCQSGNDQGVFGVVFRRQVVIKFFRPAHMRRVDHDQRDPMLLEEVGQVQPVVPGRLHGDDHL